MWSRLRWQSDEVPRSELRLGEHGFNIRYLKYDIGTLDPPPRAYLSRKKTRIPRSKIQNSKIQTPNSKLQKQNPKSKIKKSQIQNPKVHLCLPISKIQSPRVKILNNLKHPKSKSQIPASLVSGFQAALAAHEWLTKDQCSEGTCSPAANLRDANTPRPFWPARKTAVMLRFCFADHVPWASFKTAAMPTRDYLSHFPIFRLRWWKSKNPELLKLQTQVCCGTVRLISWFSGVSFDSFVRKNPQERQQKTLPSLPKWSRIESRIMVPIVQNKI